ncbi:hypothetical protein PDIG_77030 [Penicillium digitatum PHI26]|uniref:Uncharacterized protein n=2 Tax=Penicillium digitatum TaxID=36651 RepID=K9FZS3_PEND2|nr:hypothetical protein PDIP_04150 [Penicillium digitatum Pd1]EKV06506.1 hypothetical protein PDIG_77030 [Penicillium digitatum PHI26]EKV21673.1 hypothetical protein PDIP_04150 [Penicillium digitatum Pd1]
MQICSSVFIKSQSSTQSDSARESLAGYGSRKLSLRSMMKAISFSLAVWMKMKLRRGTSGFGKRVWGGGRLWEVVGARLEIQDVM